MKKKLLAVFLVVISVFLMTCPAFAATPETVEPRLADWSYKYEPIEYEDRYVRVGYAAGQYPGGAKLGKGGSISWIDGGDSVQLSVAVTYGVFSVSATLGSVTSGVTAYNPKVPDYLADSYVKLVVYKTIRITKYAVYRRHALTSEEWTFVEYQYRSSTQNIGFGFDKVG